MVKRLISRRSLIKEIYWRQGVRIVALTYALLQLVYNLIAWLVPPENQAQYQLILYLRRVPWYGHVIFTLAGFTLITIEGTFRAIRKREQLYGRDVFALQSQVNTLRARIQSNEEWLEEVYDLNQRHVEDLTDVYRDEIAAIKRQLEPALDLIFEAGHPFEVDAPYSGGGRVIRIGVKNTGGRAIDRAMAQIDEIQVGDRLYKSLPLPYARDHRELEFSLAPEEMVLVQLAGSSRISKTAFLYQKSSEPIPFELKAGTYNLIISALGTDTKPRRKQAMIEVDSEGDINFKLISD